MTTLIPVEKITGKIYYIRNIKVMLDRDLAELYEVQTKALKQACQKPINIPFNLNKGSLPFFVWGTITEPPVGNSVGSEIFETKKGLKQSRLSP